MGDDRPLADFGQRPRRVNGENGELDAILPRAGAYTFEIGPCAVWGNPGMIEICAE
jgi:hypothetical protein